MRQTGSRLARLLRGQVAGNAIFLGNGQEKGDPGGGFVLGFQLQSPARPTSLGLVSAALLWRWGLCLAWKPPGCARNKTPCPLRGPSTSLHSSDNSSPVLLTLAAFPKFWLLPKSPLHQAADLGRPAWLSHPIVSRPGLSAGHRAPRRTFWAPELGTRRGEVPVRPFGGGCWGHEQPG